MTLQEIQYKAQAIMQEWRDEDSAPYVEFVEELALMDVPELPEDLEEAAQKVEDYYDVGEEHGYLCCHRGDIKNTFIGGAKWQREQIMDEWLKDRDGCFWDGVEEGKKAMEKQMMKEAVEGKIQMRYSGCLCAKTIRAINEDKFKFGDKVRVIVIKEDK